MEPTEHEHELGASIDGIAGYAQNAIAIARQVYEWPEVHRMLVEAGLDGAKVRSPHSNPKNQCRASHFLRCLSTASRNAVRHCTDALARQISSAMWICS